ncbi:MAG: TatD family hydrolase [Bacteroidales bacterium]|jgi:TatD DNase family protein|nr:TatD family hydrolase [Bacteroidales bacterium]
MVHVEMIDTHAHLYDEAFHADRDAVIARALEQGVSRMLLPNIDADTVAPMLELCSRYPNICFPMAGLHPTSVTPDFEQQLKAIAPLLNNKNIVAIGEIGIDLYWDKQYRQQQTEAFRIQLGWAKKLRLPVVIHCRKSYNEIMAELKREQDGTLRGVFHCFPGNEHQADEVTALGFELGIGGVVTYKNAEMARVVQHTDIRHILTETDAPYLPPVPYRGKRNESAYIYNIVKMIAELKSMSEEEVATQTANNAKKLFSV